MATETAAESGPSPAVHRDATAWHGLTVDDMTAQFGVNPSVGLDSGEVEERRSQYGPNKLAEAPKEPGWHSFLRQYRDLMPVSYTHLTLPTNREV